MDLSTNSIVATQKQLINFEKTFATYKKVEFYTTPFFGFVVIPILAKELRDIDVFAMPKFFIIVYVFGLSIGIALEVWIYKYWYEPKLKQARRNLEELENFEV